MSSFKITAVLGPTASGKSDRAIQLAIEQNAHIISADALQVYRKLDIGTAKVSSKQRESIPHYLIDIKDISEHYSVVEFIQKSNQIIQTLKEKNIPIIICGGTALYQMAYLYEYKFPKHAKSNSENRNQIEANWDLLNQLDPKRASEIHPNDHLRIQRALEIAKVTQKKPSTQSQKQDDIRKDIDIELFFPERDTLYNRINERVLQMFKSGWVEEADALFKEYPIHSPGFKAIGYPEIYQLLQGDISEDRCIEIIQQKTRHFAKRQYTWYRKIENHEKIKIIK